MKVGTKSVCPLLYTEFSEHLLNKLMNLNSKAVLEGFMYWLNNMTSAVPVNHET